MPRFRLLLQHPSAGRKGRQFNPDVPLPLLHLQLNVGLLANRVAECIASVAQAELAEQLFRQRHMARITQISREITRRLDQRLLIKASK